MPLLYCLGSVLFYFILFGIVVILIIVFDLNKEDDKNG